MPRRSPSPLRTLLRLPLWVAAGLVGMLALMNVAATVALAVLTGLLCLAAWPVRQEIRLAVARFVPRHRRRVRMSDVDVDVRFVQIVRTEFGPSR